MAETATKIDTTGMIPSLTDFAPRVRFAPSIKIPTAPKIVAT